MTTPSEVTENRARVFATLAALLADWRASGRKTTTAGVTSALIKSGVLNLEDLGLDSNSSFWEAAEQSGVVRRERLETGHWLVLLPGESLSAVLPAATPASTKPGSRAWGARLRTDLWSAFVDWEGDYRRFWDRERGRAFFSPSEPGWIPDITLPRFIEITPALQETQIAWMMAFADAKPEELRKPLVESLEAHAQRGAFSKVLFATGLQFEWRNALRDHVVALATNWADAAGIDPATIFEPPRPSGGSRGATSRSSTMSKPEAGTAPERSTSPDHVSELRARVHRIVDVMSWDDLAKIPLRGEHLLGL